MKRPSWSFHITFVVSRWQLFCRKVTRLTNECVRSFKTNWKDGWCKFTKWHMSRNESSTYWLMNFKEKQNIYVLRLKNAKAVFALQLIFLTKKVKTVHFTSTRKHCLLACYQFLEDALPWRCFRHSKKSY